MSCQSIKEYSDLYQQLSENNQYKEVAVLSEEWELVTDSCELQKYLPKSNSINVVTGITERKPQTVHNFESIDLSNTIRHKLGFIINTGSSIWAIDFVPQDSSAENPTQYLGVGGYNSTIEHHSLDEALDPINCHNTIQIWSFNSSTTTKQRPRLDMCLLHDYGVVTDFKWCPFSVYEEKKKLGILAVLFNDGSVRIFTVPHPGLLREGYSNITEEETVFIKVKKPRLLFNVPRTKSICFTWGDHSKLACGTLSGGIVVWNILDSLLRSTPVIDVNIPNASLFPVRCIAWKSLLEDNLLFYSDTDGNINLLDLKDPFISSKIFRVRCTYTVVSGTGHDTGFIYAESDGVVKKNFTVDSRKAMSLTAHNSHVWDISVSPLHCIIASVGSNGTALIKPFAVDNTVYTRLDKTFEFTLYALSFDEQTQTLRYIDGLKPKTHLPDRVYHNVLVNPVVSLHKIAWNKNRIARGWIASGGAAGLCRLEYTGCR